MHGQEKQDQIPLEAEQINSTAAGLHNNGEYSLAAEKWKELIQKYPNTSLSNKARYYLGVCHYSLKEFDLAIDSFRDAISKAANDKTFGNLPDAYLLLGFSQFSLSKAAKERGDDEETSAKLLADAVKSYEQLLEKFPDHKLAQDARYFKGEAHYHAGDLGQAVAAFQHLVENKADGKFYQQALYDLGETQMEMGQFQLAIDSGETYLAEFPNGDYTSQVRMRIPSAQLQLALAASNAGDFGASGQLFADAEQRFSEIADDASAKSRDDALFKQAFAILHQQRFGDAADTYAKVVELFPDSPRAAEAAISAGRFYFRANQDEPAKRWLLHVEQADNEYYLEAQHWLCRLGLKNNEFAETFERANSALAKAQGTPLEISLMLDAGDALFEIPERRNEAADVYQNAAKQFPQHELAPQALYNAAFTRFNSGDVATAADLAEQFTTTYPESEFFPDIREIAAEIDLRAGELTTAQSTLEDVLARFDKHPHRDRWNNRVAWIRFLRGDHDGVIAWLRPIIDGYSNPQDKAEALLRVAASQFQLQQFQKAIDACEESLAASAIWSQAGQVRLLKGRAEYGAGNLDDALQTFQAILDESPQSGLTSELNFRIAEILYEQQDFVGARQHYQLVIDDVESEFRPYASYGLGWLEMKQERYAEAIGIFSNLLESYPQHTLNTDALLGRGMSHRLAGSNELAIADLDKVVSADIGHEQKISALYERGLAEVGLSNWDDAVDTFSTLLEVAPDAPLADRYQYELAWAQFERKDAAGSAESFAHLAERFPKSPLAAEAHFRAALYAYQQKEYAKAIEGFVASKSMAQEDSLKEKAMFRQAWAHFHLGQFNEAHDEFNEQVRQFPQGELSADALTMIGESLYKSNQHALAVTAFKTAIPELEKSPTATPGMGLLSRLHGAQSANLSHEYQQALEFALPILEQNPDWEFIPETLFEIGVAHHGLGENDKAIAAWEKIVKEFNAVGARARFMVGETLFGQKQYDAAIDQFKLVIYGYGGDSAGNDVKKWQANSAYEAARCYFVRISSNDDPNVKKRLIEEATKMFNLVVEKFPESSFVEDAQKSLKTLEALR
ncbi:MAG TPA: tetratricopeptide repeat protein [Pirellulaceae bacterium]|mgnify:CR=1 FL=1|nr:tetratricopeptide repeat protein [Pirellulaceae bacterium]HMO92246.1 tetratricopeptide repeat protein [Pirellulaceae bacterium]HMP70063.1 tetratricopeptide repeat protein [Pirellulaceae bacterium]